MKEKKVPGVLIISAGIVGLVAGMIEKRYSTILIGIGLIIMGSLYFYKKSK